MGKRIGRPPEAVPPAIAAALCEWLAEGNTLRAFCRQPGMPSRRTVDYWREKDPEFAARVARARDDGYGAIAEDCVAIADDGLNDTYVDDDGNQRTEHDVIARSKLRVETRLKLLACWDPKRYGPKSQVEHSGAVSLDVVIGETLAKHGKDE